MQPVAQEPAVAENSVEGERSGDPVGPDEVYSSDAEDLDDLSG